MLFEPWSLTVSIGAFVLSATILLVAGVRLARVVDLLADRTGIGEAVAGAVLLGATTSLPGLITTIVGALAGEASFAVSNALGGIAAQTMFLALADLSYRRANLEHAAASVPNILQAIVLIGLCGLVFVGVTTPHLSAFGVHAVTPLLPIVYLYGLHLARRSHDAPMWRPHRTRDTRTDEPDRRSRAHPLPQLWIRFAGMAAVVAITGVAVGHAGLSIVAETSMRGSVVGGLLTSVITSLPELVTVFAAVRIGALTLAVGDIIGGNVFDVLFIFAADLAYREAPVYGAVDTGTLFLLALTVVMTAMLAAGLVYRERKGIGFEGISLLVLYAAGVVVLVTL
ncbi:MAG: sodium:calcium antiporter [Deltaproteobacteria bacterium]|nr:MAG: sodium:calcium antiporter [Deltaproteobacteria bacterium]